MGSGIRSDEPPRDNRHTPGPWTQYAHGSTVYGADGFFVTAVQSKNPTADARLIAAAPELISILDEILNYEGGAKTALDDPYLMERAQAVVDKAEGRL